ncbi:hypothetical protein [Mesorhizobium sp. ANAO-SY3R2]|uniref:hypothetical protein n=1 Tax=Mesorhizobium sp. ANAO-SY3R2 TaxID=3166644 RepID=UPI0036717AB1
MLRSLSEEVVVNLKDRLRDVRHFVRASRHDNPGGPRRPAGTEPFAPPPEIERLLGRAASVVDDTLTVAETLSRSLLPIVRPDDGARLHGFDTYFATGSTAAVEGERLFRRDVYAALKAGMGKRTDNQPPLHEASLAQAHQAIRRKHGTVLGAMREAGPDTRLDAVAEVAAATLVELLASQQFQSGPAEDASDDYPGLQALAPVALAAGIATLSASGLSDADLIESASMAVEARRDRIVRVLHGAEPVKELAAVFRTLLAHLP